MEEAGEVRFAAPFELFTSPGRHSKKVLVICNYIGPKMRTSDVHVMNYSTKDIIFHLYCMFQIFFYIGRRNNDLCRKTKKKNQYEQCFCPTKGYIFNQKGI